MDPWIAFILLALMATVFSLISGIASMTRDGNDRDEREETWMWRRIAFQAVAAAFVMVAIALE
ncbi:MAG TPA: twin transmembrane helix small protein [Burkholderiaceae bacterium]|nr:twin transmembrane helix small protein [Burkholderiaceae bacterium]